MLLEDIKTVEELFSQKYPEVFNTISLSDLEAISERVLVIVDGLDELQDIYDINAINKKAFHLKILSSIIDTKNRILKNHKVVACGRPKACEFVKQHFVQMSKTIEVVGFSQDNILKYIDKFFIDEKQKAMKVKNALNISNNLKVMSTVPVFLWVICCVYGEELITKPLNTFTELYTYATLIFLRDHFRGNSPQSKLSLYEILENDEIMKSVYALMSLSVKTYMKNEVLFREEDIKQLISPTQLERTGFIVRYKRGNLQKPVYQFRHLVLQEYLCSLNLCVTKWVSPHISNSELSSCSPVIFGIQRLLKENDNELFISFFRKLSSINRLEMGFLASDIQERERFFKTFLTQNCIEIPDCMVIGDELVINTSIPECQHFLILLFESKAKIECPFASCIVVKVTSKLNYRNIVFFLRHLSLKIVIKGDTLLIDDRSSTLGRFISDGIEIEQSSSITSAEIKNSLPGHSYNDALVLLKHLKLKIKIPALHSRHRERLLSISDKFISDGIEMVI